MKTLPSRIALDLRRQAAIAALLLVAACPLPSDSAETDAGVLPHDYDYRPCDLPVAVGGFRLELAARFTGFQGQVLGGVVPQNVPEEVQRDGACHLYRAPALFCDPSCDPGETCGLDGGCIPYPLSLDVGTVTIVGLEAPLSMGPSAPGNYYTNPDPLPHPGFAEGAEIQLQASGGETPSFVLGGWGVGPLVAPDAPVPVQRDHPVALTWTPMEIAGPALVHVKLSINNHGGTPHWIECDVEDTGAFEIPTALVNALFEQGTSGFPNVILTRRSADSTALDVGCVQFLVTAEIDLEVEVPGLTSCSFDEDCPQGQTCLVDLTCA